MSKDGITGQMRMATQYGAPAPGMLWCSGFEREPHQVPADDIYPGTCRCRSCRNAVNEQYRNLQPPRVDTRRNRRGPSPNDERMADAGRVHPGNALGAGIYLPQWGYGKKELDRSWRPRFYSGTLIRYGQ